MEWPKNIKSILSAGFYLKSIGINNWALDKEQALTALDEAEEKGIAVLGGDVYEIVEGVPESNYDNWFCEPFEGELFSDFVVRSIDETRKYLENYQYSGNESVKFVLVLKEK